MAANGVQVEPHGKNKKNGSSPETREEHGRTDSDTPGSQTPCWEVKCVCVCVCVCVCMCAHVCTCTRYLNSLTSYWRWWYSSFHYMLKKRIKRWKEKNFERDCSDSFKACLQNWLRIYYWLYIKTQQNTAAKERHWKLKLKMQLKHHEPTNTAFNTLPIFFLLLTNVKVPCI